MAFEMYIKIYTSYKCHLGLIYNGAQRALKTGLLRLRLAITGGLLRSLKETHHHNDREFTKNTKRNSSLRAEGEAIQSLMTFISKHLQKLFYL
jgi:hypothetical protein